MSFTNEAILEHLIKGQDLDEKMVRELVERMLSGSMAPAQIAASLALLRAKTANALEISVFAESIINKATPIERPNYLYADVVGTGGDGHNTINVSTLASFTAAAIGLPVAKHGNTSVSSKCGSADVLSELGININLSAPLARQCLDEYKWCFLYAPLYHQAFKSVKDLRKELKIKTIFNIIGPLVNPLSPPVMLIGVYDPQLIMPFALALKNLSRKRALIVHGSGLDEIALHGPTTAVLLDDQTVEKITLNPDDLGLKSYGLHEIKGGDPKENAQLCYNILSGEAQEAKIAMVAATTGALLWLGEKSSSLRDGTVLASEALYAGEPARKLQKLKEFCRGAR